MGHFGAFTRGDNWHGRFCSGPYIALQEAIFHKLTLIICVMLSDVKLQYLTFSRNLVRCTFGEWRLLLKYSVRRLSYCVRRETRQIVVWRICMKCRRSVLCVRLIGHTHTCLKYHCRRLWRAHTKAQGNNVKFVKRENCTVVKCFKPNMSSVSQCTGNCFTTSAAKSLNGVVPCIERHQSSANYPGRFPYIQKYTYYV